MTLLEAIQARHSVRAYREQPLAQDTVRLLQEQIAAVNRDGGLHVQLVLDEPKAFQGRLAKYGKFSGVTNYLVMAGRKTVAKPLPHQTCWSFVEHQQSDDLDERVGYYGEHLVLLAQTLGLNTCWVGLSYSKVPGTYVLHEGEKVVCYIAIGYGKTQGHSHKIKSISEVSNVSSTTPSWFRSGVEAALLAPTAVNQQKFSFQYLGVKDGRHQVLAKKGFSLIGYTKIDLGIAKYHFEIGACRGAVTNP